MDIQKTTNYEQFKTIQGNRDLNPTNLKLIMRSIMEMNLLPQNPILVNEQMEIVDGQHRLEVAKRLQLPIYYVFVEGGSLRDVIRLNANRKLWTPKDYMDSYIKQGNHNYQILKDFMNQYKLRYSVAIGLLMGRKILTGGSHYENTPLDLFRNGDFKADHVKYAEERADQLLVLAEFCEDECWRERSFVQALQQMLDDKQVDFREFLEQQKASKIKLSHHKNTKGYLRLFEDIMGFKKRNAVRLY